jgi:hypothetical protein
MKRYLLLLIFSWLGLTTFGKNLYSLSKEDFVNQFKDSSSLDRIYCYNEKGNKVWLFSIQHAILIAKFNDNQEKKWMLQSVKYVLGAIQATESNLWIPSRKINQYNIAEITAFTIEVASSALEKPYFNLDSVRVLNHSKNDSILKQYASGTEHVLFLILKNRRKDTLVIMENACYDLTFKNNCETNCGVVQKITKDSILISSNFNQNVSNRNQQAFKFYHFPIEDIQEIRLLKTGGYGYKSIKKVDFQIGISERKKERKNAPIWYSLDSILGTSDFFRSWLTEGGFSGITEKEGKIIWYEE